MANAGAASTVARATPILMIALLLFVLSFAQGKNGDEWDNSLSADAFANARFSLTFAAIAIVYSFAFVAFAGRILNSNAVPAGNRKIALFAMTEFPALLGFCLAFINTNMALFYPFIAISLLLYLYAHVKAKESGQS